MPITPIPRGCAIVTADTEYAGRWLNIILDLSILQSERVQLQFVAGQSRVHYLQLASP